MLTSLILAISITFSSPVRHETTLAGNFGEPRPNHFHGGIDVKTGGVEKKAICSVADGYVSRVTTGLFGFGNAVYVTHPNGITTVYCHLRSFESRIERLVNRWRYDHKCSYVTDARFSPTECPVSEGQFIALSGNTGSSTAPHLHLEIHDTKTWMLKDPLTYLSECIKDTTPPMAHGFMAYPQQGEGMFAGEQGKMTYGFTSHVIDHHYTAWGKVGFGIWANDYIESSYNHLGVYKTQLLCDEKEVFSSIVDNIPIFSNRQINIWGDYDHYRRSHVWYLKSFDEPGCKLDIIHTDSNGGIIDFNEQRTYELKYILSDRHGNETSYIFFVEGTPTTLSCTSQTKNTLMLMRHDITSQYVSENVQLIVPCGMLGKDTKLSPTVCDGNNNGEKRLSPKYTFTNTSCPLTGYAELNIRIKKCLKDTSKLYLRSNRTRFIGGEYKDGWLTGKIRDLGDTYEVMYDDRKPVINFLGNNDVQISSIIRLCVNDEESGMKHYETYIDGKFVYFAPIEKSNTIQCDLTKTNIKKTGKSHKLRFVAVDNRNNKAVYTTTFIY